MIGIKKKYFIVQNFLGEMVMNFVIQCGFLLRNNNDVASLGYGVRSNHMPPPSVSMQQLDSPGMNPFPEPCFEAVLLCALGLGSESVPDQFCMN